jgi:predicted dehydrogenase
LGVLLLSGVRHQAGYAPILRSHPRLRIVGLADEPGLPEWMHRANARLADELDVPYWRDVDDALGRSDVQVVSVCPEPTRHARLAARAAAAGKHVLVDKPAALCVAECDPLIDAAARGGGVVTFVHRLFSPAIQRMRAEIEAGRLGLPWAMHVSWLTVGGVADGSVEDERLVVERSLSGGGELANFLGYPVGYARYLTGLEVRTVYATLGSHTHDVHRRAGVEDFGVVSLTLEHAVPVTITVGRLASAAAPGRGIFSIRLHASHGSVMVDEYRPRVQVVSERPHDVYGPADAGMLALEGLVDDFVRAIDSGSKPMCGLDDAHALAAVLEAAYASARSGRVERI